MVTINEVKRYMNGARNVKKQLLILENAESNIIIDNLNVTASYSPDHVDNSNVSNPTEDMVIRLDKIRANIRARKMEYASMLFDRIELIDSALKLSSIDNLIIKQRYIENQAWKVIGNNNFYSYKYLMVIHSRSIKRMVKYINSNKEWLKRVKGN